MADCKYLIERSNLHYVRKQASEFLCDLDQRVTSIESSPSGGIELKYKYTTSLSGDPTAGYGGANTLDSTTVTELRISTETAGGNDASIILLDIGIGDILAYFEDNPPNNTSYYEVTGVPTNEGTWFRIPVVSLPVIGSLLPSANNVEMTTYIVAKTVTNHDDLQNVTEDQHHPKSHSHDGADGSGTVSHADLTNVTADQHHPQVHNLYGSDQGDVDSTEAATLRDLLSFNGTKWSPDRRTRYIPAGYVSGQSYQKGDEVSNGSEISEAIVDGATESPFIAPTGEVGYVYEGTLVDKQNTASQLIFGTRYELINSGYIVGYRVYVKAGYEYRVTVIDNPLANSSAKTVLEFTASSDGWTEISVPAYIGATGHMFDVIVSTSATDPAPTEFTGNWDYLTPQNIGVPPSGVVQHPRSNLSLMHMSGQDFDGADRTSQLNQLTIGDSIIVNDITWTIQAITFVALGNYYEISVAPSVASLPTGLKAFTFQSIAASPIESGWDSGYWTSNPPPYANVWGLEGVDIPYEQIVPNGNAYGLDIKLQAAYVPTEWKVKVLATGGGSGGGGDFTPTVFAGAGTTGYVPDPVTQANRILFDDGDWKFVDYIDVQNTPTIITDHTQLTSIGSNTHPEIDNHIADFNNPHQVTYAQLPDAPAPVDQLWSGTVGGNIWNANSGNVGIGTTSPYAALEVSNASGIITRNPSSAHNSLAALKFANQPTNIVPKTAIFTERYPNSWGLADNMYFCFSDVQDATTEPTVADSRMVIQRAGNVGIGTTNPSSNLDVASPLATTIEVHDTRYTNPLRISQDQGNGNSSILDGAGSGQLRLGSYNNGSTLFMSGNGTVERARITSAGNLGVGESAPARRLTVQAGGTNAIATFGSTTANGWVSFTSSGTSADNQVAIGANNDDMRLIASGVEKARLKATGEFNVGSATTGSAGAGSVNVQGNYYINGVPIETFTDAPADGETYGRNNNAWVQVSGGGGTISNLASVPQTTLVDITNTGGTDARILEATVSRAGVMTSDHVGELVTAYDHTFLTNNPHNVTLAQLGYTGDLNANDYVHPSFTPRSLAMTGATVPSAFTSNNEGHVTGFTTRTMTPADIGAAAASDIPNIAAGTWTPSLSGASGSISVTGIWTTLGNMVFLVGRITANTNLSGTGQVSIAGLPFQCDISSTGISIGGIGITNRNTDGNGFEGRLDSGTSIIRLTGLGGNGSSEVVRGQDISGGARININIMYYSNAAASA